MAEFKIKFRGVRGSYPVVDKDFLEYGGNTSCVEVRIGDRIIILDAGTGLISLGKELMKKYIKSGDNLNSRRPINVTLLISHIHQDHIQGFPFFAPLHIASSKINIFGNPSQNDHLEDELSELIFNKTFPLDAADIAANVSCYDINETGYIIIKPDNTPILTDVCTYQELSHDEDDVIISCYKSFAHPQNGVIIYKIEYQNKVLVYATDKESYVGGDIKLAKFAKNCNCLIHDTQYTTEDYQSLYSPKQGYGHSTFDMVKNIKQQVNAEKLVCYHYSPDYNDEKLNVLKDEFGTENLIFAKEGLEVIL